MAEWVNLDTQGTKQGVHTCLGIHNGDQSHEETGPIEPPNQQPYVASLGLGEGSLSEESGVGKPQEKPHGRAAEGGVAAIHERPTVASKEDESEKELHPFLAVIKVGRV